ncbi:hypothetical protein JTE90_004215 [Oedothorax gibbosus]|uniref:Uncharacterized protein n=1 Tax=Oedothorax gibbosus TaxID=931172 RepID=A0AAV6V4T9_9ARAC|nr:hypothetical protein JTE90_004215 [Oedothorax gibbosus]
MTETRCCCGCCSLSTATRIALTLSAIQAMIGLIWNIELLLLLNKSDSLNPLDFIINVPDIEDFDVVHGLTLAAIGLNIFWLIFAILAARGNATLSHGHLAFWDLLTYLITLFDMGATIFFSIKFQDFLAESPDLFLDSKPTKTLTYLILLVAFSKGGIFLFMNLYLAHIVQLRGKEIHHDHSVLALYVISHLSRCSRANEHLLPHSHRPPPYASSCPYFVTPTSRCDPRSESNGSQWSLSYDAIQGMSKDPPYFTLESDRNPSIDLARALSRNPSSLNSELPILDTNASASVSSY